MVIETLTAWSARRSGGRITVIGTDETGAVVKVANVDLIQFLFDERLILATTKDGEVFRLATGVA
jgi:hypothetical protein